MLRLAAFSIAFTFAFSAIAGCARATDARGAAGSDCRRFDLQPRPSWLFWGEWVNDGTELILPETLAGRLLRYKRSGEHLRSIAVPSTSATFTRPNSISNTERGVVVLDVADRLVGLQADLRPAWEVRLSDVRFPRGERVEMFHSFIDVDADFIGFTVLVDEKTQEKWWGIARLRLGDSPRVERVHTLPSMMAEEGSFYFSHAGPYLAKAGGAIYALLFGRNPHIERLLPAPGRLVTFPAGYNSPALGFNTWDNTVSSFRAWEASTAPVALFGRGLFLYLLARRPRADRSTQWTLFQIDPQRDQMIRSIELPTRASHVVVLPGSREWAIVEKGRVAAVGDHFEQPVGPVLFIRSSVIEDRTARADLSECLEPRQ